MNPQPQARSVPISAPKGKFFIVFKTISDAVKDDEIENWAAKKIQNSFKQYKYQKNLSQDGTGAAAPTVPVKKSSCGNGSNGKQRRNGNGKFSPEEKESS